MARCAMLFKPLPQAPAGSRKLLGDRSHGAAGGARYVVHRLIVEVVEQYSLPFRFRQPHHLI